MVKYEKNPFIAYYIRQLIDKKMNIAQVDPDKVDKLAIDGGGANVDGDGVIDLGCISRLDVDDMRFSTFLNRSFEGCSHLEIALPQNVRYFTDNRQTNHQSPLILVQLEETDQSGYIR